MQSFLCLGILVTELIIGVNGITPLDPNNGTIQLQEGKLCVDKLSGECFHLEKRNAIYQMTWNGSGFQGLCLNFQEFTARAKQNCIDELTLPNGVAICQPPTETCILYIGPRTTARGDACQCPGNVAITSIKTWPHLNFSLLIKKRKKAKDFIVRYHSIVTSNHVANDSGKSNTSVTLPTKGLQTRTSTEKNEKTAKGGADLSGTSSTSNVGLLAGCLTIVTLLTLIVGIYFCAKICRRRIKKQPYDGKTIAARDEFTQSHDAIAFASVVTSDVYTMAADANSEENVYETMEDYGKANSISCNKANTSHSVFEPDTHPSISTDSQLADNTMSLTDAVNDEKIIKTNALYETNR